MDEKNYTDVKIMVFAIYECPGCLHKMYKPVGDPHVKAFQCNCGAYVWVRRTN